MKIIQFLYLIFLFCTNLLNAQSTNEGILECSDLRIILENKEVINHFKLAKAKNEIFFVDTFQLVNCKELIISNIKIIVLDKYTNEISKGDESFRQLDKNRYLVIKNLKCVKNKYEIGIWQANDNAFMKLVYNKKRKPKIKIIDFGVF